MSTGMHLTKIGFGSAAEASWVEIDASALLHNVGVFRQLARREDDDVRLGVVLKGDAYGHGLLPVLSSVHEHVDCVYVITAQDALAIRHFEREAHLAARDVLVLGAVSATEAVLLAEAGVAWVVGDATLPAVITALRAASAPRLQVHLHVDTGLSREGFLPHELVPLWQLVRSAEDVLHCKGVLSHFANVEDVTDQAYARQQVARFEQGVQTLAQLGAPRLERHMAASAASLVLPSSRFDTLRVGIGLYGLWPSSETRLSARVVLGETPQLRPVLSWRCRSQVIRTLEQGAYVGYGCTYRCTEPTRIAVFPVGYFDGYPRLSSGRAHVLVGGRRCAVIGRVMMNHIIVDVTHADIGDASSVLATLIGSDGEEQVGADVVASWADTISYEIVTRIGAHVPRRAV